MQETSFGSLEGNTSLLGHTSALSNSSTEKSFSLTSLICSVSFIPSIVVAFSALLVFYLLYFSKSIILTSIIFVSFSLSSLSLIFLFLLKRVAIKRIDSKQIIKTQSLYKKLSSFFLFICLGANIATIAYARFLISVLPPLTLAKTQKVTKITASLLQDASPVGSAYYKAKIAILNCKYDDNSTYSYKGEALLFVPSIFIKQNYRGNVTLRKKGAEIQIFSKGVVLELEGHFAKIGKSKNDSMQRFIVSQDSDFKFEHWSSPIFAFRAKIRFYLNKFLYGWKDAGSLLQALLTANKDFLDVEEIRNFNVAGLSHILALSGMHLAIIGGLAHFFSSLFLGRKLVKFALLSICFLFLNFAGASPSLLRSFLMLCIFATSRLLYVKVDLLAVLAFTFSLHLLSFPQDAITLSFILSYSALFGILFFSNSFYNLLISFIPDCLCSSISASLGATLTTAPIIAISFGKISIIGIIASCIISPLISSFLVLGISFITFSVIAPIIYHLCGTILNIFYDIIIAIIHIFALFPTITCETTTSYALSFLPFMLGIVLVIVEKHCKHRRSSYLIIK